METMINNPHNFIGQTAPWNTKEIGWLAAKSSGRVSKCNNSSSIWLVAGVNFSA